MIEAPSLLMSTSHPQSSAPALTASPARDQGGFEALSHFANVATSVDIVDSAPWLSIPAAPIISPPAASVPSVSPNASSSGRLRASNVEVAQARPIPKVVSGRRMAAFTDPEAYEAPFRPLAYNPDTFRNAEITAANSDAGDEGAHTPRSRGDPIDEGVLTEEGARALFNL